MVNDHGQIYTIEGVTAGIIMIVTAYLVLSTTTIFTPGDVHITDMQLEQIGNDALSMLDNSNIFVIGNTLEESYPNTTSLSYFIQTDNVSGFNSEFDDYLNKMSVNGSVDKIKYTTNILYRNGEDIGKVDFGNSGKITGRENTIKVTRLVLVNNSGSPQPNSRLPNRIQMVLVEVLLWRG